jgi:tetratricopeptide (TPR) repeat protein
MTRWARWPVWRSRGRDRGPGSIAAVPHGGRARRHTLALALALAVFGAGPARADEAADRQAALRLQTEGLKLLDQHDAAGALDRFRAAYALVPSPKVLFNLGRAHLELGHRPEAFECFDVFLAEATNVPPRSRADAELFRSELRPTLAFVDVVGPAGARVEVDGQGRGSLPLPRPLAVEPATHLVTLTRDGAALLERRLYFAEGAMLRVAAEAPALAALPAPPPPVVLEARPAPQLALSPGPAPSGREATPIYRHWWFWTVLAVAAASATAAAVVAGARVSHDAGCPSGFTDCK